MEYILERTQTVPVSIEDAFAFDITAHLQARNEVWIDAAAPPGEVALEFRAGE